MPSVRWSRPEEGSRPRRRGGRDRPLAKKVVMLNLAADDGRAIEIVTAIHRGDLGALHRQLADNLDLAAARIVDDRGVSRTLLHIVTDWPGHFPDGPRVVAALIAAGADVNARVIHESQNGPSETALHWAASSDDVDVLDALIDGGGDIEATGAVFTGGTPMSDAVVFAQWRAARRLLERGATTTMWQAAALGLLDRVRSLRSSTTSSASELTNALWHACRGGQREVAEYLLGGNADLNWIGYEGKTPLDVAYESSGDLVHWLRGIGAKGARELGSGRRQDGIL
jgi:ankyrin repeat protein